MLSLLFCVRFLFTLIILLIVLILMYLNKVMMQRKYIEYRVVIIFFQGLIEK